jgi:hypothetical protein
MRILVVLAAALAVAAPAAAGGWATVSLASLPQNLSAGDTWRVELTVLRHARTPTDGAKPSVTIRNAAGAIRTFPARPTGRTGRYAAEVVFPSAGTWRYSVDNGLAATGYGLSQVTTYAPVQIGPAGGSGFPLAPLLGGLGAAAAAAGIVVVGRRRRRPGGLRSSTA